MSTFSHKNDYVTIMLWLRNIKMIALSWHYKKLWLILFESCSMSYQIVKTFAVGQFSRGQKPSGWETQFPLVGKHIGSIYIQPNFTHMMYIWLIVTHNDSWWLITTHRDSSSLIYSQRMTHISNNYAMVTL